METIYMTYFSRERRLQRRAARLARIQKYAGSVFTPFYKTDRLTTQNVGPRAIEFVRSILAEYTLPSMPSLSYSGTRKANIDGNIDIIDGVITVSASMKTASGIGVAFDVPVLIRGGEMQEPSVIMYKGIPRLLSQSTFDSIVADNTIIDRYPARSMYSAPDKNVGTHKQPMPRYRGNVFSINALRNEIRSAIGLCGYRRSYESEVGMGADIGIDKLACDSWDPAERGVGGVHSSSKIRKLKSDVEVKDRGGVTYKYKAGSEVIVLRDLDGTGEQFVVQFPDTKLSAIVSADCI
jgi:hypothetical protein